MSDQESYSRESWIDPRIGIKISPIAGKGMFGRTPIKQGEVVVIWGGTIFTREQVSAGKHKKGTIAAISESLFLGELPEGPTSPDNFMNHSCDPNVWMEDEVTLVARRAIAAGEELTADYAMWEIDPDWVMPWSCKCGSGLCRARVTGGDWKLPELQQRYRGHFSPFINERIIRSTGSS